MNIEDIKGTWRYTAPTSNGYYDGRRAAQGIDTAKPAKGLM